MSSIRSRVNLLKKNLGQIKAERLKERLFHAYYVKVLDGLRSLLEEEVPDADRLEVFLSAHWELVKGTLLSYTAQPDHELTQLLCEVAKYVSKQKSKPPLKLLMPTVCMESIGEGYENLDELDVESVLKSHIQNEEGTCLLPIKLLSGLSLSQESKLCNPYFDYSSMPKKEAYVDKQTLQRLLSHSSDTEALRDAKTRYEALYYDQSNLLGHLTRLIQRLRFKRRGHWKGRECRRRYLYSPYRV